MAAKTSNAGNAGETTTQSKKASPILFGLVAVGVGAGIYYLGKKEGWWGGGSSVSGGAGGGSVGGTAPGAPWLNQTNCTAWGGTWSGSGQYQYCQGVTGTGVTGLTAQQKQVVTYLNGLHITLTQYLSQGGKIGDSKFNQIAQYAAQVRQTAAQAGLGQLINNCLGVAGQTCISMGGQLY